MEQNINTQEARCCPKFNPEPWDGKTHQWQEKPFIKESIPVFFHMPWPPTIGNMMERMWGKAEAANAAPKIKDFIIMANDPTPWKSDFYMLVTKEVPDAENVKLSGTFMTKVFDGPYGSEPKWIKAMDKWLSEQGKKAQKYYFYYTTCPRCSKIYGHNYTIIFAQV